MPSQAYRASRARSGAPGQLRTLLYQEYSTPGTIAVQVLGARQKGQLTPETPRTAVGRPSTVVFTRTV